MPDLFSETFTYRGNNLDTHGMRVVLQRQLASDFTATVDYGYGGVLDLIRATRITPRWHCRTRAATVLYGIVTRQLRSSAVRYPGPKPNLLLPTAGSAGRRLRRWTCITRRQGSRIRISIFTSGSQSQAPASCPATWMLSLTCETCLAQGYVPLLGQDGHTVYLVQSARSIRGGVAFSF